MGSPNMHDEKIRKILARNFKVLLEQAQISQYALAQKTKNLSQKQVNNIAEARTGCGVDALSEIASVLSIPAWVLLYEHLEEVSGNVAQFASTVDAFSRGSESDRALIAGVAKKVGR